MNKILIVIPARLASVRLPEKPLALIHGKPMIQWVYEATQALSSIADCVVATESERILECVESFGGHSILTSEKCVNGTERVFEAFRKLGRSYETIVNVQGDEPMMRSELMRAAIDMVHVKGFDIGSAMTDIATTEELKDFSCVKALVDQNGKALYFSRYPIPYSRINPDEFNQYKSSQTVFRHLGLYVYKKEILENLVSNPPVFLEQAESLEQLRAMYLGYSIGLAYVPGFRGVSVDTAEDLERVKKALNS